MRLCGLSKHPDSVLRVSEGQPPCSGKGQSSTGAPARSWDNPSSVVRGVARPSRRRRGFSDRGRQGRACTRSRSEASLPGLRPSRAAQRSSHGWANVLSVALERCCSPLRDRHASLKRSFSGWTPSRELRRLLVYFERPRGVIEEAHPNKIEGRLARRRLVGCMITSQMLVPRHANSDGFWVALFAAGFVAQSSRTSSMTSLARLAGNENDLPIYPSKSA